MKGDRHEGESPNHSRQPPPANQMNSFCGLNTGLLVELNAVVNVCLSPVVSAWRSSRNAIKRALLLITLRCLPDGWETKSITWKWGGETRCYKRNTTHQARHSSRPPWETKISFKANTFLKETLGFTRTDLTVMLYTRTVKNYIP
jgi:hypothetical protein